MKVVFNNNNIDIIDSTKSENKNISDLWSNVREDYIDWLNNFRLKKVDNDKTIAESLTWKGMSVWWLSTLSARDSEQDNRWLHRLMVLYLCKEYGTKISVTTDDRLLVRSIHSNFSKINVDSEVNGVNNIRNMVRNYFPMLLNGLRLLISIAKHLEIYILLIGLGGKQLSKPLYTKKNIWFRSIYPANWVQDKNGDWMDRHIRHSPKHDQKYDLKSGYLMYVKKYNKDKGISFFEIWNQLRCIKDKTGRNVLFVESYLSLFDILECYYSSIKELWKIKRWMRFDRFTDYFIINGIDLSCVLLDEWRKGYFYQVQNYKLHSLAIVNFLSNFDKPQIVVTYGEFFAQSRYAYHASKLANPGCKFVAMQHATFVKNKMYGYYRKDEFDGLDDDINYIPRPDYYLAQGDQYASILREFYDKDKTNVIGCLKYDAFNSIKKDWGKIRSRLKLKYDISDENIIVLSPSIDDALDIFSIIKGLDNLKTIRIMLSPHPATNINDIKIVHHQMCPNLDIKYISDEPTYNLFTIADLVVCGYSTVAIEAAYFGVQSLRARALGRFPLFDEGKLIPSFSDSESFILWYQNRYRNNNKVSNDILKQDLAYNYFYKIDNGVADRLWKFLETKEDLLLNA